MSNVWALVWILSVSFLLGAVRFAAAAELPFAPPADLASPDGPIGLAAADLDRDGDLDVVSASEPGGLVAWHQNPGDGSAWIQRSIWPDGVGTIAVVVGDLDGDGDLDVVAGSNSSGLSALVWYENDGTPANGGWIPHGIPTTDVGVRSVAVADVDLDGDLDVLSASETDNRIDWFANDGIGSTWEQHLVGNVPDPTSMFAADVNGDGLVDVVSASPTTETVY
jgi:hypothetical protein